MLDTKARITIVTPQTQQGAVMIVTLLFLVLITMIGVWAVKNSTTNLRLATSDQINTVLLQSADSANNKIEQAINDSPDSAVYNQIMSDTGIIGRYILDDTTRDDIIDFCYRPRTDFFNIDNAVIRRGSGKLINNSAGYCDPSKSADYTSGRETTMTQVMIKNISATDNRRLAGYAQGNEVMKKGATKLKLEVYSTSVLPAYGSSNTASVKSCFEKDASSATDSVADCMSQNGIPSKTLVEQIVVENDQQTQYCKLFGDTTTGSSGSSLCSGS